MTTIIRAEAAHDFLALLPTLAGYRPERSLVAVAFSGNRTAGVIRFDLPAKATDVDRLAERAIAMLCRLPDADAIVPVVYSETRYRGARGRIERELLLRVAERADDAGFLVRDVLRVARDGWGSLLDPGTPASGRSLGLIDASPAASHPAVLGRVLASPEDSAALPEVGADEASAVVHVLAALGDVEADGPDGPDGPDDADGRDGSDGPDDADGREPAAAGREALLVRLGALCDPVALIEHLATGSERDADPRLGDVERFGWLIHLAQRPSLRDAMMLQIAFGEAIGTLAIEDAFDLADRAAAVGLSVDALVRRERAARVENPSSTELLANLLLGLAADRPDVDRTQRGLVQLKRAIALAPAACRPPLLCMGAWLSWSLGRGSAAWAFLERAAEIDPEYSMATLLSAYFGSGVLPEWAFRAPEADRAA